MVAVLLVVAAGERPGFSKLLEKLEAGNVLAVTKMDRLGRKAMDVRAAVESLAGAGAGVHVHCLALGGVDLTSPVGKMTMGVIAAVAEFERELLIERTQTGLARAKADGKALGRPSSLTRGRWPSASEAGLRGCCGCAGKGVRSKPPVHHAGK